MISKPLKDALVADCKKACDQINVLLEFWGCDSKFIVLEDGDFPQISESII